MPEHTRKTKLVVQARSNDRWNDMFRFSELELDKAKTKMFELKRYAAGPFRIVKRTITEEVLDA
jgi:hypothetical protein